MKKKDIEEATAPGKGGKGKAPAKAPPKAAKAPAADKGKGDAPAEEEDESAKRILPEPVEHINREIVQYLNHFKSKRLIKVVCKDKENDRRKRSDEEKQQMAEAIVARQEKEKQTHEEFLTYMSNLAEKREKYKAVVNEVVSKGRDEYKTCLTAEMENRNKYREMISTRKDKEKALLELLA